MAAFPTLRPTETDLRPSAWQETKPDAPHRRPRHLRCSVIHAVPRPPDRCNMCRPEMPAADTCPACTVRDTVYARPRQSCDGIGAALRAEF